MKTWIWILLAVGGLAVGFLAGMLFVRAQSKKNEAPTDEEITEAQNDKPPFDENIKYFQVKKGEKEYTEYFRSGGGWQQEDIPLQPTTSRAVLLSDEIVKSIYEASNVININLKAK